MGIIREHKRMFTSFESIMEGLVYRRERLHFELIKCRLVFTDGFQMPKGHCKTNWELKEYLRGHKLDVTQPFGTANPDFFIVKLTDYEHDLAFVLEQIKTATQTMRTMNPYLPESRSDKAPVLTESLHMKQFDVTRDLKGCIYGGKQWRECFK